MGVKKPIDASSSDDDKSFNLGGTIKPPTASHIEAKGGVGFSADVSGKADIKTPKGGLKMPKIGFGGHGSSSSSSSSSEDDGTGKRVKKAAGVKIGAGAKIEAKVDSPKVEAKVPKAGGGFGLKMPKFGAGGKGSSSSSSSSEDDGYGGKRKKVKGIKVDASVSVPTMSAKASIPTAPSPSISARADIPKVDAKAGMFPPFFFFFFVHFLLHTNI